MIDILLQNHAPTTQNEETRSTQSSTDARLIQSRAAMALLESAAIGAHHFQFLRIIAGHLLLFPETQ